MGRPRLERGQEAAFLVGHSLYCDRTTTKFKNSSLLARFVVQFFFFAQQLVEEVVGTAAVSHFTAEHVGDGAADDSNRLAACLHDSGRLLRTLDKGRTCVLRFANLSMK